MNPKKNVNVQIGEPLEDLPPAFTPRGGTEPSPHWTKVGGACLQHEGQWLPIRIGHLSVDRHRQVVSEINRGRLAAFKHWPGFEAAFRDGQLYVRYVDPEDVDATEAPHLREVV